MKRLVYIVGLGLVAAVTMGLTVGCDDDGDSSSSDSPTSEPPISVLGKWEAEAPDGFNFMLEFTQQTDANASGTGATHGTAGVLTATVSGNVATFAVIWPEGSNQGNATGGATEGTATVNGTDMVIDSPDYSQPFTIHLL